MDWGVSKEEIKSRIERIFSDIFSERYDMNITVKFKNKREVLRDEPK